MLTNKFFFAFTFAVSGCSVQLAEPLVAKVSGQPVQQSLAPATDYQYTNNDIDNNLVINRVSAYPAVVPTGSSALLSVDYADALGRPVGITWECNEGVLLSNKGQKTHWYAPDTPGKICDCEVMVRSKSGVTKATVRLMVQK